MSYITTSDGVHLHFKDVGKGRPVVLIHGWPLTGDMWEKQVIALVDAGYRVITYDRRGFGLSGHPIHCYSYDTLTDDLATLINSLDLYDATLVGFSMGGGEVARYLSRYGTKRIAKAVLLASIVPFLLKTSDNPDGVPESVLDGIKQSIRADRFDFLENFIPSFYGDSSLLRSVSKGVLNWSFSLACMASPMATIDCVDTWGKTDLRPDLQAFTLPTLILHGSADANVPPEFSSKKAAELIPGAIYKEYKGAAHGLFFTHADQVNEDLIEFLSA
ncbi:alpha/beta fold hydrolase [Swingsia samuiensis]|uniref:Alpha/beta hydrolase n=1 Tax=Swingsia samuiensis TaxID=1293412 RepID=A0A4Y6UM63_9PROT|nr:alpha/beta hydrolase [Swingsia samuiensis]QDH17481.1 alpha/beta hydrolase [Swingsia samuiensis]